MFCDDRITIVFFFSISSDKLVMIQNYMQLNQKPLKLIREQEKNPCFY